MDIKTYAAILLVARLISMAFIFSVLLKQWSLFKIPIESESEMTPAGRKKLRHYRTTLFVLALIIFVGNIIPAAIDILTIFADLPRSTRIVKPISLVYTITAAGTSLVSSYLIWRLYQLSREVDDATQTTEHGLLKEETNHPGGSKNGREQLSNRS